MKTPLVLTLLVLFLSAGTARSAVPEVSLGDVPSVVRVDEPFWLSVDVTWNTTDGQFTVERLDWGEGTGFTAGRLKTRQRTEGSLARSHLEIEVMPSVVGPAELGPLTLRYRVDGGEPEQIDLPGTLALEVLPAGGVGGRGLILALGAVMVGGIAAGVGRWRRPRAAATTTPAPVPLDERFTRCRAYVQDGDLLPVYAELLAIKRALPAGKDPLPPAEALEQAALHAKYSGQPPDRHTLERWLRAAEVAAREAGQLPQVSHKGER